MVRSADNHNVFIYYITSTLTRYASLSSHYAVIGTMLMRKRFPHPLYTCVKLS